MRGGVWTRHVVQERKMEERTKVAKRALAEMLNRNEKPGEVEGRWQGEKSRDGSMDSVTGMGDAQRV